jgi:hypothetical protein
MKYFLLIDFDAGVTFDGFRGNGFKEALKNALENDPEMTGWTPDSLIQFGIEAKWDKEENDWEFARGHFEKYVEHIYNSYMSRKKITILDITDPLATIDIKQ